MFPKEIKYVLVYTLEMNFCTLKKLQGSLHSRKIKPDFNILKQVSLDSTALTAPETRFHIKMSQTGAFLQFGQTQTRGT